MQAEQTGRAELTAMACRTFAAGARKVVSGGAVVDIGVGEDDGTKTGRRYEMKADRRS